MDILDLLEKHFSVRIPRKGLSALAGKKSAQALGLLRSMNFPQGRAILTTWTDADPGWVCWPGGAVSNCHAFMLGVIPQRDKTESFLGIQEHWCNWCNRRIIAQFGRFRFLFFDFWTGFQENPSRLLKVLLWFMTCSHFPVKNGLIHLSPFKINWRV